MCCWTLRPRCGAGVGWGAAARLVGGGASGVVGAGPRRSVCRPRGGGGRGSGGTPAGECRAAGAACPAHCPGRVCQPGLWLPALSRQAAHPIAVYRACFAVSHMCFYLAPQNLQATAHRTQPRFPLLHDPPQTVYTWPTEEGGWPQPLGRLTGRRGELVAPPQDAYQFFRVGRGGGWGGAGGMHVGQCSEGRCHTQGRPAALCA